MSLESETPFHFQPADQVIAKLLAENATTPPSVLISACKRGCCTRNGTVEALQKLGYYAVFDKSTQMKGLRFSQEKVTGEAATTTLNEATILFIAWADH